MNDLKAATLFIEEGCIYIHAMKVPKPSILDGISRDMVERLRYALLNQTVALHRSVLLKAGAGISGSLPDGPSFSVGGGGLQGN